MEPEFRAVKSPLDPLDSFLIG